MKENHPRHTMSLLPRLLLIGLPLLFVTTACAKPKINYPRTPLIGNQAQETIRNVPMGLLEIVSLPPEKIDLLFFPDDVAFLQDVWTIVPSVTVVPPTDILLLSLRHAGLRIESYRTLNDAKMSGAKLVLMGVVKTAHVKILDPARRLSGGEAVRDYYSKCVGLEYFKNFKENFWKCVGPDPTGQRLAIGAENINPMSRVEAFVEANVAIVDVYESKILWSGPLTAKVEDYLATPFGTDDTKIATDAALGLAEPTIHALRVLVTQCYSHIAAELVSRISETLPKKET